MDFDNLDKTYNQQFKSKCNLIARIRSLEENLNFLLDKNYHLTIEIDMLKSQLSHTNETILNQKEEIDLLGRLLEAKNSLIHYLQTKLGFI